MSRYTGPKTKICRRERADVYPRIGELVQVPKRMKKRSAPGEHPIYPRLSQFGLQFREKQKVKRMYGMTEKQFKRFFEIAIKKEGNTGLIFLQLLEMRLDNVVFRAGLAKTRNQARQFVNHGHVLVNGKKVDIPSYIVKVGDEIELEPSITSSDWYTDWYNSISSYLPPSWIQKIDSHKVKVLRLPERQDIELTINEQNIVEYYSR
ncbi:MAG: 30S ribosomal protein S4 [Candidatus Dojkabacteria bacterium]|nr:30S ribosomal protein S4 [Candidatus Dojkabacteria bacterium]